MSGKNNRRRPKIEESNVEVPGYALENMDAHLSQLSGQGGIAESFEALSGALTARDLTFPCTKRTMWGDQVVVKVIKKNTPTYKTI